MGKYYAVKNGRNKGIYETWAECEEQVKGYKGSIYKSFTSKEDALDFLNDQVKVNDQNGLIAYVDGSYNIKTKEYGYGVILLEGQTVVKQFGGKSNKEEYVDMRNVAGEITGSVAAIQYAIEHHYPMICIYYDYEGIEKWATHQWKANKEGTKNYQRFIDESKKKIDIHFIKVLAHSGDFYNERADYIAKKAVGIS